LSEAEPEALYTVEGEEGMIARVFKHEKGFSVNVTDTDSGASGDSVRIFPTLEQAKAHADTINPPSGRYPTIKGPWVESVLGPKPGSRQNEINRALAEKLFTLGRDSRKVGHATGTWFEFNGTGESVSIRHYYTDTELSVLKSDFNKAKSVYD
jgi:hypothetical protein